MAIEVWSLEEGRDLENSGVAPLTPCEPIDLGHGADDIDWLLIETVFGAAAPLPDRPLSPSRSSAFAKRTVDILLATFMLIISVPLVLAIAIAIKATSRGAVFFRQSRVGRDGRSFELLKFRSMCSNAEAVLQHNDLMRVAHQSNDFKLEAYADKRVTAIGRLLRRTSLDELPQLWNVLKGDMSLVGPRPIVPPELERYETVAAYYLAVKPGLTGAWQVFGRSAVKYPTRAYLDAYYAQSRSMLLDCRILVLTIPTVLSGRGAY